MLSTTFLSTFNPFWNKCFAHKESPDARLLQAGAIFASITAKWSIKLLLLSFGCHCPCMCHCCRIDGIAGALHPPLLRVLCLSDCECVCVCLCATVFVLLLMWACHQAGVVATHAKGGAPTKDTKGLAIFEASELKRAWQQRPWLRPRPPHWRGRGQGNRSKGDEP